MKLNHLSLAVPDVVKTATFMEQFFGFKPIAEKGNGVIVVMENGDNFVLVLTTLMQGESPYPSDFYFGYILNDEAAVWALYEQMIAAGVPIPRMPSKIRNSQAFYFHLPGDIMMEVSCPQL